MKSGLVVFSGLALAVCVSMPASGQSETVAQPAPQVSKKAIKQNKKQRSAGGQMASGNGDIGKGAAKGAADLGKGTANGAVDLATGHPIDSAVSVGRGAASAGEHVGEGTVKGGVKIGKGVGGLFHHHHHKTEPSGE